MSESSGWHGWAGLTAESGNWLLFDRYIIPVALDLFTKQHVMPQKAPRKKEGVKAEGLQRGEVPLCTDIAALWEQSREAGRVGSWGPRGRAPMSWHFLWDPPLGPQQQKLPLSRVGGLGSSSSEAQALEVFWWEGPCLGHRGKKGHAAHRGTPQEVGEQSRAAEPGCPDAHQHTGIHLKGVSEV